MIAGGAEVDVLLIEDNPDDAELALRAVGETQRSLRVVHMEDGVRALDFVFGTGEFASRGRPALPRLVLLDLKLSRMDGHEVLHRLREDPLTATIPVVVLTSSSEARDVQESYRRGANSYVVKPVNFDAYNRALAEVVRYWLEINRAPSNG